MVDRTKRKSCTQMRKGSGQVKLTKTDRSILDSYLPVLQGLAAYLGSCYEVVLHSLEDYDHSVIGIINGEHTGREVGAPITGLALDMLGELSRGGGASTLYFSRNKKGEPLKSTAIAVRGGGGRIIGLICINLYLSSSLCDVLAALTPGPMSAQSGVAFENFAADAGEMIRSTLARVRARVLADGSIPPSNKNKVIVEELEQKGIFRLKDAVVIVAGQLGVSRNTVYMHLRNYRRSQSPDDAR